MRLGIVEAVRGVDHKIRPKSLVRIRRLLGEYGLQLRFGHLPARKDALALHSFRRSGDHNSVNSLFSAGLEQERDVHHDDVGPVGARLFQKRDAHGIDDGVNDGFEFVQRLGIMDDALAKSGAVDRSLVVRYSGKRPFKRRDRLSAGRIGPVNGCVSVKHRHSAAREHLRGRRLAHADRSGETENDHG